MADVWKKTMEQFPSLKVAVLMLRISGNDIENDNIVFKVAAFIGTLFTAAFLVVCAIESYVTFESIDGMAYTFITFNNWGLHLLAMIGYRIHIKTIKEIIISVSECWPIDYVDKETADRQTSVYKLLYKGVRIMNTVAIFVLMVHILTPLFVKNEIHPIDCCTWFLDETKSPNYELIYFWEVLVAVFVLPFIMGLYVLYYFLVTFCYCQIMMLKEAITQLNFENVSDEIEERKTFTLLKIYIKHHNKILKMFDQVNSSFSVLFLGVFYNTLANNTLPLYLIATLRDRNNILFVGSVFTMVCSIGIFFMQCSIATIQSSQLQSLANVMYNCNWNHDKLSPRLRAAIILIIMKSQREIDFVAGGVVKINMETFTAIMNMSFSIYTLLKSFR